MTLLMYMGHESICTLYASCIDDQIIIQQHSQRAGTDY